jgi:hypothetical protein
MSSRKQFFRAARSGRESSFKNMSESDISYSIIEPNKKWNMSSNVFIMKLD